MAFRAAASVNGGAGAITSVTGTARKVTASPTTGAVVLTLPDDALLVTPTLGTPASGTLTNCTGLPLSGLATGTAQTWTPVDASGAGLSLTVVFAKYVTVGPMVTVWGVITFPSTANGSNAVIGGLPVAAPNTTGVGGAFIFTAGLSAFLAGTVVPNTATFSISNSLGAATTNVSLSTQTIRFQFAYNIA